MELSWAKLYLGKLGFEAFDRDDKCLGVFPTQRQAASALLITEGGP
jgi:hypothetical protein